MKKQNLSFNTTTAHFSALPARRPNGLNLLRPASEDLLPPPTLASLYFGTPGPNILPRFWHSVQRVCQYSSILVPDGLPLLWRPCTKLSATTPDCLPRLKNPCTYQMVCLYVLWQPCTRLSATILASLYQMFSHYSGIPAPDGLPITRSFLQYLTMLHRMILQGCTKRAAVCLSTWQPCTSCLPTYESLVKDPVSFNL